MAQGKSAGSELGHSDPADFLASDSSFELSVISTQTKTLDLDDLTTTEIFFSACAT
jgi:hypothetical protein